MDEYKFENICFCCLTEEGQLKNMMDEIFVTTKVKVQFVEGYTVCSGIAPDDESTKNICLACEDKLKSSYEFRELCRNSYQTLKERTEMIAELYVNVKHEVPSEDEENFVYSSSKKEGKTDQFNQVYVRDTYDNGSPAKKPKKALPTKAPNPEPSPIKPDADQKPPLIAEHTVVADDDQSNNDAFPSHSDDSDSDVKVEVKPKRRYRVKKKEKPKKIQKKRRFDIKKVPIGVDASNLDANFICHHCDIYLHSHNDFLTHREQHMTGHAYQKLQRKCNLCNIETKFYIKHIEEFHKDYKPNTCNYCTKGRFQTPSELKSHLFSHVKCEPTHTCLACKEKFKNEVSLRSHISYHRNTSNQYLCPYCGLEYQNFLKCQEHFFAEHDDQKKLYPCFFCKRIYMVGKWYEDHECMKNSKPTEPGSSSTEVKCDGCTVLFTCQEELDCHRSRGCLQDSESIKCPECGKEFETKPKLKRHLKTHDPKKRLFVCDQCGHGSMSESQMKLHKFMHVTDRPFKCHLCPATFKLDQHLKGHQKVHKVKPFECYICEKRFRTYDNIRLHMGTHSDASVLRRFTCELCGKTSVSGTALGRHMKTHTNEQNFKCDVCQRTFRDIGCVNKHYRKVHEGMYYECKFCGKNYKEKMKFRNHLYVHRGFKPYHCPVCPSQHVEKYIFVKHLRGQHNVQFVEKLHGYRETEDINTLIEECVRIPYRKGEITVPEPSLDLKPVTIVNNPSAQQHIAPLPVDTNIEYSYATSSHMNNPVKNSDKMWVD